MNRETADLAARVTAFWRNVDIGRPEQCWPWTGYTAKGCGRFSFDAKMASAAELALTFGTGEIRLPGLEACRRPDCTALCCNPAHLRFNTRQGNADALWAAANGIVPRLTPDSVALLRRRRAAGAAQATLAAQYGISEATVSVIVRGLQWKDAGGPIQTPTPTKETP